MTLLRNKQSKIDPIAGWLSLQDLFYRETQVEVKSSSDWVVSPCRGKVAAVSSIGPDGLIPEKKRFGRRIHFPLTNLVQKDESAALFYGGDYINLYLSPWDYHFLIFPTGGKVRSVFFQDGFNWPVVAWDGAIFRNSKMVSLIDSDLGFPIGLVMVASWMVGGLEGLFNPGETYQRADLFGRFRIGSTIVLLFPPGCVEISCQVGQKLELGAEVAKILSK